MDEMIELGRRGAAANAQTGTASSSPPSCPSFSAIPQRLGSSRADAQLTEQLQQGLAEEPVSPSCCKQAYETTMNGAESLVCIAKCLRYCLSSRMPAHAGTRVVHLTHRYVLDQRVRTSWSSLGVGLVSVPVPKLRCCSASF